MNTIFIVLPILTLLMFDLGLTLKPQDFKLIAQRPKPVIVGLVGQIILLPLIAWGIIALLSTFDFRLSTLFIIGIMLVACSPGGSSSNVFSMLAKGDVALSVTLTACSSIITLFTLPLIMAWVTKSVQMSDISIQLPIGNLLIQNIVLMVVPISVGFIVNIYREQAAAKIHNVLKRIAMPALVLLVTVFFFQHKQTIVTEFASLVIEIGMQNAAQAITIACSPLIFNNEIIAIPAIIYALMMNLILLAYVGITKIQRK